MIVGTSHRQVKKCPKSGFTDDKHRGWGQGGVQFSEFCVQIAHLGGNNAGQSALSDPSARFQTTVASLSTAWTAGAV